MIAWLIGLAAPYLVKAALVKYGLSAAQAALLAPRVIATVKDAAAIFREMKDRGGSDEKAVEAADRIVLRPQDKKLTLDDILKSESQPNV